MARIINSSTTKGNSLIDTNIYNPIEEVSTQPVLPTFTTTSTKADGIVKLVNRFIKLLYTLKGSNYVDKQEGTYLTRLFSISNSNESYLQSKIVSAIRDAEVQIKKVQEKQGVPLEEKLKVAQLVGFWIDEERKLQIEVTLEVMTGYTTPVSLPSIILG